MRAPRGRACGCSVGWASSSDGVSGMCLGARREEGLLAHSSGHANSAISGRRAPGSAGVPSSCGLRLQTMEQGGEWGGWRKDGAEPSLGG